MSITELARYLVAKGYDLNGCSVREIAEIERFYNVKLPAAYRDFLWAMGKGAGAFMKGSSVFYDDL